MNIVIIINVTFNANFHSFIRINAIWKNWFLNEIFPLAQFNSRISAILLVVGVRCVCGAAGWAGWLPGPTTPARIAAAL